MELLIFIVAAAAFYFLFKGMGSGPRSGSTTQDKRSDAQRFADEFEMDSYDDEEHWDDD